MDIWIFDCVCGTGRIYPGIHVLVSWATLNSLQSATFTILGHRNCKHEEIATLLEHHQSLHLLLRNKTNTICVM